jgi:hypothetical protein
LPGWAFSSLVSLAIVFATAATLNSHGVTDIATSARRCVRSPASSRLRDGRGFAGVFHPAVERAAPRPAQKICRDHALRADATAPPFRQ